MITAGHTPSTAETVTIRPICPGDEELEREFIHGLSQLTRHFRFFGGVSELPPAELTRLCRVDGKNSMAYVATVLRDGREVGIGVGRYAPGSRADTREMAITVADAWQHSSLGTRLLQKLIETATRNGVRKLYAVELAGNRAMAAIAREQHMSELPDPADPHQVIYSLDLAPVGAREPDGRTSST